jgi:hypothetical protein
MTARLVRTLLTVYVLAAVLVASACTAGYRSYRDAMRTYASADADPLLDYVVAVRSRQGQVRDAFVALLDRLSEPPHRGRSRRRRGARRVKDAAQNCELAVWDASKAIARVKELCGPSSGRRSQDANAHTQVSVNSGPGADAPAACPDLVGALGEVESLMGPLLDRLREGFKPQEAKSGPAAARAFDSVSLRDSLKRYEKTIRRSDEVIDRMVGGLVPFPRTKFRVPGRPQLPFV